jgi:hypothetical protein
MILLGKRLFEMSRREFLYFILLILYGYLWSKAYMKQLKEVFHFIILNIVAWYLWWRASLMSKILFYA